MAWDGPDIRQMAWYGINIQSKDKTNMEVTS